MFLTGKLKEDETKKNKTKKKQQKNREIWNYEKAKFGLKIIYFVEQDIMQSHWVPLKDDCWF